MSDRIQIMQPMPVVRFTVSAGYVILDHASGLDYAILKMVEYGQKVNPELKISELLALFSFADDMAPMMLKELEDLKARGLISCPLDRIRKDSSASKFTLTESGESMCEKGYTVGENGRLEEKMLFFPARVRRFEKDDGFEAVRELPAENQIDSQEITQFVLGNRDYFHLDPAAEIVSRIRSSEEKKAVYKQPLVLDYDENEAVFSVTPATGVDVTKIRELGISAEDILGNMPESCFDIPDSVPVEAVWQDSVPDIRCGHVLPKNLKLSGGLTVADTSAVKISSGPAAVLPEGYGFHMADIQNARRGRRYWFVRQQVTLDGFEGGKTVNMILRQKMNEDEVSRLLDEIYGRNGPEADAWIDEARKKDTQ